MYIGLGCETSILANGNSRAALVPGGRSINPLHLKQTGLANRSNSQSGVATVNRQFIRANMSDLKIIPLKCPSCGAKLDRDHNASENIKEQGLIILSGSGTESDIKQKRCEALPVGESVKPEAHPIAVGVGG